MFYLPAEFWDRKRDEMLRLSLELCDALLGLPVNTHFTSLTETQDTEQTMWSVCGSAVLVLGLSGFQQLY